MKSNRIHTDQVGKQSAGRGYIYLLMTIAILTLLSCSSENSSPPKERTAEKSSSFSKLDWADMLLRPGDTTRVAWIEGLADWPNNQNFTTDADGRVLVEDLEFAFHTWVIKNLDFAGDTVMGGLRASITVAATHVPNHLLMAEFSIDSVLLYRPGAKDPAVRKKLFPARRKFLEGVWQVEFVQDGNAPPEPDFPEGTQFSPRAFVSWKNKKIIFQLPDIAYEYIQSPKPEGM